MGKKKQAVSTRGDKEQVGTRISADVMKRARAAVFWTPGLTLAGLVEAALNRELDRLEKQRGEPFKEPTSGIPTGRPVRKHSP